MSNAENNSEFGKHDKDFSVMFAALGDPTRLAIFDRLADGKPRSISVLSDDADMTRQAVTKHLRVLEAAGLVQNHRVGRESQYAFCPEQLAEARAYLDQVAGRWESALMRLKSFVEDGDA
ncbi:MAG: helix-turn-helix transcriptional regulator [Thalassospira sp.]|uniref:ArsR/SmtB family transcription factor n=1 Tax=Thalassospira sp. TaxID=1912094 RepID=UPI001AFFF2E8|nr:metalloregulator ArsR/SmtB family transcription factor [Thalassospira sp.]MBO6579089.1 helix-turn-helix transcriptional regulator [Thalassospira sp.]MBO6805312.1 helix-turn-helix transcriptional regulator [Thalassospira sp.]MBO6817541.1 helix-turn-helix transcriptional regulator [Thalassospira sp.]MBO6887193.1 helix-turn-helix transcriptional regulator [Thalassospira sp.]